MMSLLRSLKDVAAIIMLHNVKIVQYSDPLHWNSSENAEPLSFCLAFVLQMSEREPELQVYLQAAQIAREGAVFSSVVPVFGQSFCQCDQQQEVTPGLGLCSECFCGEEDQGTRNQHKHMSLCSVETGQASAGL